MQCLESAYTAHGLLRNAHVQSVLSSSAWRKQAGLNRLTALGVTAQPRILSLPDGTRLSGLYYAAPAALARNALTLLLAGLLLAAWVIDAFLVFKIWPDGMRPLEAAIATTAAAVDGSYGIPFLRAQGVAWAKGLYHALFVASAIGLKASNSALCHSLVSSLVLIWRTDSIAEA